MFSIREILVGFGRILQGHLFPVLETELGPLSDLQQQLVRTLVLLRLDMFVEKQVGRGRPGHDRGAIARASSQRRYLIFQLRGLCWIACTTT
jgi:hypothetical protein